MTRRLTTEQFITKAKTKYGDLYDYSEVNYHTNHENIKILCKEHGEIEQTPSNHLRTGCGLCSRFNSAKKKCLSTKDVIDSFIKIHGDRYDYSKVDYLKDNIKVEIICKIHGSFYQNAYGHKQGQGCQKCFYDSMFRTNDMFIESAKLVHGNKYDYSLTKYIDSRNKVEIICSIHGSFWQNPDTHLRTSGCNACRYLKRTWTQEQFLNKVKSVHGNKYDYSKTKYVLDSSKVIITCPKHGDFSIIPHIHKRGGGCKKCFIQKYTMTQEEFLKRAKEIHGNKYDYFNLVYKTALKKVEIICRVHGSFWQQAMSHLRGAGCKSCRESGGEAQIERYLKSENLIYKREYIIPECKYKKSLRFDFAVFKNNKVILIEFQGLHHYKVVNYSKDPEKSNLRFNETIRKDEIKREFCSNKNIPLIEICCFEKDIVNYLKPLLDKELCH